MPVNAGRGRVIVSPAPLVYPPPDVLPIPSHCHITTSTRQNQPSNKSPSAAFTGPPLQVWSTRVSSLVLLRPLRRARVGADLRVFPAITRDLIESREKPALLMQLPCSILRPVRKILKDFPAQMRYYQSMRENRILRIDRPSYGGTGVSYCGGIPRAILGIRCPPHRVIVSHKGPGATGATCALRARAPASRCRRCAPAVGGLWPP